MQDILYHGTKGTNILSIINSGEIRPGSDHRIFFSRFEWEPAIFHGADGDLGASFAIEVRVDIPDDVEQRREPTQGVRSSLIITTNVPLKVQVLQLFAREARADTVQRIKGDVAIRSYLQGRLAGRKGLS